MAYADYFDDPFISMLHDRMSRQREERSPISPQGGRDFLNQLLSKLVTDDTSSSLNDYVPNAGGQQIASTPGGSSIGGGISRTPTVPRVNRGVASAFGSSSVPSRSHSNQDLNTNLGSVDDLISELLGTDPMTSGGALPGTGPGTYTPGADKEGGLNNYSAFQPGAKKKKRNRGASTPRVTRR